MKKGVIKLSNINLSEHAQDALNAIYKEYDFQKNHPTYHDKIFFVNSVFSSSDNSTVMSSLVELSSKRMIYFFSDRRIMLTNDGITYIKNGQARQNGFTP